MCKWFYMIVKIYRMNLIKWQQEYYLSDFDVNLVIFSQVSICFQKGFKETNDGVREKSLQARPATEMKYSIRTRFLLCLKDSMDVAPCPRVEMYRLTSMLCQPLSLSYCRVSVRTKRNQSGGRLIIVSPEFDGRGGDPSS